MTSPDYQGPLGQQQQYFMGDREIGQGAYDQMQQLRDLGSMGLLGEKEAQQAMLGIMTSPQMGAGYQDQQAGYPQMGMGQPGMGQPGMGQPGMPNPYEQAANAYTGQGMDVGDDEYNAYMQAQQGAAGPGLGQQAKDAVLGLHPVTGLARAGKGVWDWANDPTIQRGANVWAKDPIGTLGSLANQIF